MPKPQRRYNKKSMPHCIFYEAIRLIFTLSSFIYVAIAIFCQRCCYQEISVHSDSISPLLDSQNEVKYILPLGKRESCKAYWQHKFIIIVVWPLCRTFVNVSLKFK